MPLSTALFTLIGIPHNVIQVTDGQINYHSSKVTDETAGLFRGTPDWSEIPVDSDGTVEWTSGQNASTSEILSALFGE